MYLVVVLMYFRNVLARDCDVETYSFSRFDINDFLMGRSNYMRYIRLSFYLEVFGDLVSDIFHALVVEDLC